MIFFTVLIFVLLFWLLFSGDASVSGIQLYCFSFVVFLFYVVFKRVKLPNLKFPNLLILILLLGCFLSSSLADYSIFYSLWVVKVLSAYVFLLACVQSFYNYSANETFIKVMSLSAFFVLIVFIFGTAISKGVRGSFIFGPNILYRVFAILSMISALWFFIIPHRFKTLRILFLLFIFIMCSTGIYFTGSRGGLIVLLVLLLFNIHLFYGKILLHKILIALIIPITFCTIYILNFLMIDFNKSRFLNFDYEGNESLSYRLAPWIDFFNSPSEWILSTGHSYIDFVGKFGADVFPYPHNIFLELTYFNGAFGFILSVMIIYQYFSSLRKVINSYFGTASLFFYITTIVLIGSLFSGNLQDNFLSISLLMILSVIKNERFKNT